MCAKHCLAFSSLLNSIPLERRSWNCSSIVRGFWLLIQLYKKGDPPADLRDADGFCYRLIRTVLSENLLHFGCKYNAFLLIVQLFQQISFYSHSHLPFFYYLCNDLGEKSRVTDALAFISHLPKMSGKLIWNKFDWEAKGSRKRHPLTKCSYAHALAWSILVCE